MTKNRVESRVYIYSRKSKKTSGKKGKKKEKKEIRNTFIDPRGTVNEVEKNPEKSRQKTSKSRVAVVLRARNKDG